MSVNPYVSKEKRGARLSLAQTTPTPPYDEKRAVAQLPRWVRRLARAIPLRDNATGLSPHLGAFDDYKRHLLAAGFCVLFALTGEVVVTSLLEYIYYVDTTMLIVWTVVDASIVIAVYPIEMRRRHVQLRLFAEARKAEIKGNTIKSLQKRLTKLNYWSYGSISFILAIFLVKLQVVFNTQELQPAQMVPVFLAYSLTVAINIRFLGQFVYLSEYAIGQFWTDSTIPQPRVRILNISPDAFVQPVRNNGGHLLETFPDGSARLVTYGLLTGTQLDNFIKDQTDKEVIDAIALAGMEAQCQLLE